MKQSVVKWMTALTAAVVLTVVGGQAIAQSQVMGADGYWSVSAKSITLQWKVEGRRLNVIVRAKTTGWVAVGFDATRKMKDANIIIGYVKGDSVFFRDDFGAAPVAHRPDTSAGGNDDIADKSGTQANGYTELRFTIPLDSGGRRDRVLTKGKQYNVILAHGPANADDFGKRHAARTTVKIKL